jgi:hypothetical protein
MLVRLCLAFLAVAGVAVAVVTLHGDHRCADAKAAAKHAPVGELAAIAAETADHCGDPRDAAIVSLVLTARGRRAAALALERRMTREHPQDYVAWLVVWRLSGDRAALARARALNPRGTPRSG